MPTASLVDRLRTYGDDPLDPEWTTRLATEAADEIARLEAENTKLLAALKEVVRISDRKHDAWDAAHAAIARAHPR
jgi:phage host-nuclease inhibitor protein Gam